MYNVAVIGGGASGMMSAIMAKRAGCDVVIAEKNPRIGKKILVTGNGRCNFTNIGLSCKDYNSEFVKQAIESFTPNDVIEFFKELGMLSVVEDKGRVYPFSLQASALLDVLLMEIERLGIEILTDFDVLSINNTDNHFEITAKNSRTVVANKVIISTGGMAAPKTGSDGMGYQILKKLGHTIIKPEPALVQLKTDKGIAGIRAYAKVKLKEKEEFGEVQFTTYGLSGIPIFNMSRFAGIGDEIILDLAYDMENKELFSYLKARPAQKLESYLIGILNKPLGQMLLKDCDLGKLSRNSDSLNDKELWTITDKIKNWKFIVKGKMPWENAQVTKGGILLDEVDSKTMESKIVKNLFVTGELLNIDAPCGGYNLQWAWSSGAVAGRSASRELSNE